MLKLKKMICENDTGCKMTFKKVTCIASQKYRLFSFFKMDQVTELGFRSGLAILF